MKTYNPDPYAFNLLLELHHQCNQENSPLHYRPCTFSLLWLALQCTPRQKNSYYYYNVPNAMGIESIWKLHLKPHSMQRPITEPQTTCRPSCVDNNTNHQYYTYALTC